MTIQTGPLDTIEERYANLILVYRDVVSLRCLTLSELKPHPLCKLHHGAINIHSLCTENKEEYTEPVAVAIQGPFAAFAFRYSLCDKVVVINWRDNSRPLTVKW
jgi:hypothetical protein